MSLVPVVVIPFAVHVVPVALLTDTDARSNDVMPEISITHAEDFDVDGVIVADVMAAELNLLAAVKRLAIA